MYLCSRWVVHHASRGCTVGRGAEEADVLLWAYTTTNYNRAILSKENLDGEMNIYMYLCRGGIVHHASCGCTVRGGAEEADGGAEGGEGGGGLRTEDGHELRDVLVESDLRNT